MTAHILILELTNLIQESKRKNQELKHAAETSLADLKSLPATSEKQVATDLSRRPQFISPFLIACSSKNSKHAAIGMSCLQRLAAAQALPKSRLKDVLDAITECTTLGFDIQLKILQTLPSLLQNYADQINGPSFFTVIQICSTLQASKTPSVSSTSAATLQQLVTSLYEKVASEDKRALEVPTVTEVQAGKDKIRVRTVAYDAYRFFNDLCLLIGGDKPLVVQFSPTSEPALLELIESILTGHAAVINNHPEQAYLVMALLIPYLIKSFSERSVFPVTVRITRILYLIIKNHLEIFPEETETILQWLNHTLDPDNTHLWKRTLCMEVFREVFTDAQLVLQIHTKFKGDKDSKPILPDCLASFVRLATEKPALIGLGQNSTVPIGHYFQRESAGEQADAIAAAGGSAGVPTSAVPGISVQFSHIRSPCIEQLDKSEAPNTPETYIYSLVLASLNNLAESLAKFIIPLTTSTREKSRKHQRLSGDDYIPPVDDSLTVKSHVSEKAKIPRKKAAPINPLTLEAHPEFNNIKAVESLFDSAWHAILACCSTFFHAALDTDNYRALVRSFQKYTQVAGLLHMTVPRDAFLTTLGKNAMPPNLLTASIPSAGAPAPQTPSSLNNIKGLLNVENIVNQASSFLPERRRQSLDSGEPTLNVRNLLCLRALLNLAIALGPSLEDSWTIVFETLQQADRVLATSVKSTRAVSGSQLPIVGSDAPSIAQQISTEVSAAQAAASRVFESTADLSNESFLSTLKSLCSLVRKDASVNTVQSPASTTSPPATPSHKRRIASFSGLSVKTGVEEHDFLFTLTKLRELATLNLGRFVNTLDSTESGWDMMLEEMTSIATNQDIPATARLLSVDLIRKLVVESLAYPLDPSSDTEQAQARALKPLTRVARLFRHSSGNYGPLGPDETAIEAHSIVLDTLKSLIEHSGEDLTEGWSSVFEVIQSVFLPPRIPKGSKRDTLRPRLISVALGRSAFSSLQLICSDFLTANLDATMPTLIDLLHDFNAQEQEQDINMSLTTTTFFWKISDFLYSRVSQRALDILASQDEFDVIAALQSQHSLTSEEGISIMWLYLLRRLSELISDTRDEVRNSAIHTTLRIFDNNGDDLSPKVWQLCFKSVLLPMVSIDAETYHDLRNDESWKSDAQSIAALRTKIGTSQVLLSALSKLLADYLESILSASDFLGLWESLLVFLSTYLSYDLHDLNAAVFAALGTILSKATPANFPQQAIIKASDLWDNHSPSKSSGLASTSNVAAFESYTTALISIYSLRQNKITIEDTRKIVDNLERCIREADHAAYSHDLDTMTSLQSRIMKAIGALRMDINGASTIVVRALAHFIGLPFEVADGEQPTGQTFIALSKASMAALEVILKEDTSWQELLTSDSLQTLLTNLERSIGLKYQWNKQGRNPALWRRATTASLTILEHAIPKMFEIDMDQSVLRKYWESIVPIAYNIANAEHLDATTPFNDVREDEQFDITSLRKLASLVTTPLGSSILPDSTRRAYTRSLFTASLIHSPSKSDLPDLDSSPLADLYSIRYGRTIATPPCPRQNMAYLCLRTLLELLSHQESTPQQIRLAKASAPYTILRAALPLRAYIADQPLRGRLPVPASLRKELVAVLRELGETRCEPAAIPATTEGKVGGQGAHLIRLFPLIRGAIGVGGPKEVRDELGRWMELLEREIGLE